MARRPQQKSGVGPIGVVRSRVEQTAMSSYLQASAKANNFGAEIADLASSFAKVQSNERAEADAATLTFQRDGNGNLVMPELDSAYTVYDASYRKAVVARYSSQVELDAREKLNQFAVDHQMKPDAYKEVAGSYVQGLVEATPPAARGYVEAAARTYAAQQYSGLLSKKAERDRTEAKQLNLLSLDQAADEVTQHVLAGSTETSADGTTAFTRWDLQLRMARESMLHSEAELKLIEKGLGKKVAAATLLRDINGADLDGARKMLNAFRSGPGTDGWRKEWAVYDPDDRVKIAKELGSIVTERLTIRNAETAWNDRLAGIRQNQVEAEVSMWIQENPGQALPPAMKRKLQEASSVVDPMALPRINAQLKTALDHEKATGDNYLTNLYRETIQRDGPLSQEILSTIADIENPAVRVQILGAHQEAVNAQFAGKKQLIENMGEIQQALQMSGEGLGGHVGNNSGMRVAAETLIRQRAADAGKPFSWETSEDALAKASEYARIGVIPEGLEKLIKRAGLDEGADPIVLRRAMQLYNTVQQSPAGAVALRNIIGDDKMQAAYDELSHALRSGMPDEEFLKSFRARIRGEDLPGKSSWERLGDDEKARRDKFTEMFNAQSGNTAWSSLWMGAATGTRPWQIGEAPWQMRDAVRQEFMAIAHNYKDPGRAIEAAFQKTVARGWGLSEFSVSQFGGDGNLRWVEFAPEVLYGVADRSSPRGNTRWIAEHVERDIAPNVMEKQLAGESLKLGSNVFLRHNGHFDRKSGEPLYELLPYRNGEVGIPLHDKTGEPIIVNLAAVRAEKLPGAKSALLDWFKTRRDANQLDRSIAGDRGRQSLDPLRGAN